MRSSRVLNTGAWIAHGVKRMLLVLRMRLGVGVEQVRVLLIEAWLPLWRLLLMLLPRMTLLTLLITLALLLHHQRHTIVHGLVLREDLGQGCALRFIIQTKRRRRRRRAWLLEVAVLGLLVLGVERRMRRLMSRGV